MKTKDTEYIKIANKIMSMEQYNDFEKSTYIFLLIISPDQETSARVVNIKNKYDELYRLQCAAQKPHLTLASFMQYDEMEAHIVKILENISNSVSPINIELDGFDGFPGQAMYIKVATKNPLIDLVKNIKSYYQRQLTPDEKIRPEFTLNPHLTIARGMKDNQYQHAYSEWRSRTFKSRFRANEMILLKKRIGDTSYQKVKSFAFNGKFTQTELVF